MGILISMLYVLAPIAAAFGFVYTILVAGKHLKNDDTILFLVWGGVAAVCLLVTIHGLPFLLPYIA